MGSKVPSQLLMVVSKLGSSLFFWFLYGTAESASLHAGERLALVIPSPDPTHVWATVCPFFFLIWNSTVNPWVCGTVMCSLDGHSCIFIESEICNRMLIFNRAHCLFIQKHWIIGEQFCFGIWSGTEMLIMLHTRYICSKFQHVKIISTHPAWSEVQRRVMN